MKFLSPLNTISVATRQTCKNEFVGTLIRRDKRRMHCNLSLKQSLWNILVIFWYPSLADGRACLKVLLNVYFFSLQLSLIYSVIKHPTLSSIYTCTIIFAKLCFCKSVCLGPPSIRALPPYIRNRSCRLKARLFDKIVKTESMRLGFQF